MAETLAEALSGNGRRVLVQLLQGLGLVVVGAGCSVRLGVALKTPCWVLKEQPALVGLVFWMAIHHLTAELPLVGCWLWSLWVVGCVFVENCTVDASIFVVKLLRAHGGCLGTRSR